MNTKLMKFTLVGLVVLALAVPVASADRGKGYGGCQSCAMKGGLEGKFFYKAGLITAHAEELGLSEQQKEEIENLAHEVKKSLIKQEADIDILAADIHKQLKERSIDVAAVNKLIDQKYELKKAKTKSVVEAIAKVKQSLSEEQYAKLKDLYKGKAHYGKKD